MRSLTSRNRSTGPRPGEKLCEELNTIAETTVPTRHDKIRIFTGPGIGHEQMADHIESLRARTSGRDTQALVALMQDIVSDYHPSWHLREAAKASKPPAWVTLPVSKPVAIGAAG